VEDVEIRPLVRLPVSKKTSPYFISAICTPLDDEDRLHDDGLAAHLAQQWDAGIHGVLVAGTMGLMQLLRDDTYQDLSRRSIEFSKGRGELMIGAGDASLARTLARVEFLNTLKGVDGVVVLSPYFIQFSQPELIAYFRAIADVSKAPVYLYDLPQRTRSKIELPTVLELAKHPNIKGIKCSDEFAATRQLIDAVGDSLRVIVASPLMVDVTLRTGIYEQLDGLFAVAPRWTTALGKAAQAGDWELAAKEQRKIISLLHTLVKYGIFPAATALLRVKGVAGKLAPRPYQMLDDATIARLMDEPIAKELLLD
jgi:4-hydroxy-tetrahydrodipicolinate synthase